MNKRKKGFYLDKYRSENNFVGPLK